MDASPIPGTGNLIFWYLVLLLLGAHFAGTETGFSAVNRIRIMSKADDGSKSARKALYILDHFDEALTTILVGNNIMHIGCAALAALVATRLRWGSTGETLASLGTTVLVFLFSETLPKTVAKGCSERFALFAAPSLYVLMRLMRPVTRLLTSFSDRVMRLMHMEKLEEPTVSEEELYDIIETLDEEGTVDEDVAELMQSALDFTETRVREIFTPLDRVESVHTGMTAKEIAEVIDGTHHSRLAVRDERGEITGFLQIRKFLKAYILSEGRCNWKKLVDKPFYVPAGKPIDEQLAEMSRSKAHIAIVREENGNCPGILTVEDILEELVGEIYDEEERGGHADA